MLPNYSKIEMLSRYEWKKIKVTNGTKQKQNKIKKKKKSMKKRKFIFHVFHFNSFD